jgi:hypothetical protein
MIHRGGAEDAEKRQNAEEGCPQIAQIFADSGAFKSAEICAICGSIFFLFLSFLRVLRVSAVNPYFQANWLWVLPNGRTVVVLMPLVHRPVMRRGWSFELLDCNGHRIAEQRREALR